MHLILPRHFYLYYWNDAITTEISKNGIPFLSASVNMTQILALKYYKKKDKIGLIIYSNLKNGRKKKNWEKMEMKKKKKFFSFFIIPRKKRGTHNFMEFNN